MINVNDNEPIKVDFDNMEDIFDEMLDKQAEEIKKSQIEEEEESEAQITASSLLEKFKIYIGSTGFDKKCSDKAKDLGIDKGIVKNIYVSKVLGKIANVLNLAITITVDVVTYAVKFLANLITVATELASSLCYKIINIFTLGCGATA